MLHLFVSSYIINRDKGIPSSTEAHRASCCIGAHKPDTTNLTSHPEPAAQLAAAEVLVILGTYFMRGFEHFSDVAEAQICLNPESGIGLYNHVQ